MPNRQPFSSFSIITLGPIEVDGEELRKKGKLLQLLREEVEREPLPNAVLSSFRSDFNSSK